MQLSTTGERFRSSDARRQPARIEKGSRGSLTSQKHIRMAIERWFYHKFHHGLTLADVERYTHLLVGIFLLSCRGKPPQSLARSALVKSWVCAATTRRLDDQGRPRELAPFAAQTKGSKRGSTTARPSAGTPVRWLAKAPPWVSCVARYKSSGGCDALGRWRALKNGGGPPAREAQPQQRQDQHAARRRPPFARASPWPRGAGALQSRPPLRPRIGADAERTASASHMGGIAATASRAGSFRAARRPPRPYDPRRRGASVARRRRSLEAASASRATPPGPAKARHCPRARRAGPRRRRSIRCRAAPRLAPRVAPLERRVGPRVRSAASANSMGPRDARRCAPLPCPFRAVAPFDARAPSPTARAARSWDSSAAFDSVNTEPVSVDPTAMSCRRRDRRRRERPVNREPAGGDDGPGADRRADDERFQTRPAAATAARRRRALGDGTERPPACGGGASGPAAAASAQPRRPRPHRRGRARPRAFLIDCVRRTRDARRAASRVARRAADPQTPSDEDARPLVKYEPRDRKVAPPRLIELE